MNTVKKLWRRLLFLLRVEVPIDGLEVTDHAIRWCRVGGLVPQVATVQLPPQVCEGGKILDKPAFLAALREVHAVATGASKKSASQVMVTLSFGSIQMFMRLFELPLTDRKRLEKAVALNLQMVSPGSANSTAAGWQVVREDVDQVRVQVAGLFADRPLVDDMIATLREAGFVAVAAESRAVSLARGLARGMGGADPAASYIGVLCDDTGPDFFIFHSGVLGFEYSVPWSQIADPQGAVSTEALAAALTQGARQIMNFYRQHWSDTPAAAFVSAGDLFETVQAALGTEFKEPILPLDFGPEAAGVSVAFGAALRGGMPEAGGQEITFLGADAASLYDQEKTLFFLRFWRTVLPTVFLVILAAALMVDFAWLHRSASDAKAAVPPAPPTLIAQASDLAVAAQTFNKLVGFVSSIEASPEPDAAVAAFEAAASASGVTISRLTLPTGNAPVTITGMAVSEESIVAFKNAVSALQSISSTSLPLSAIQPTNGGYSFTLTAQRK
jgi:hypothetical protein